MVKQKDEGIKGGAQLGRGGEVTEGAGASPDVTIGGAVGEGTDESDVSANPLDMANYIRGVKFPATKGQILRHAKDNGAPDDIMKALEDMPDQEYMTIIEVFPEIAENEGG